MSNSEAHLTLRQRAEQLLHDKAQLDQHAPAEIDRLLHELRVHQIELELQNEALRDAQATLEASRTRYFTLYDLAPVGYVTLNAHGLIQEANLTAAGLLQTARSQVIAQPLTAFITPIDQDGYYRHQRRLAKTGAPQAVELRMQRTDHSIFWARLESSVAQDSEAGDGATYRTVISDITPRMEAEIALRELNVTLEQRIADQTNALREREERLRALIDASAQIVWTADATGAVEEDSPSWRSFTGQTLGDFLGEGWLDVVHPADRTTAQREWRDAIAHVNPLDTQFRLRRHDGAWRWMWVRAVPLRTEAGAIRGWVGMNSDITVRKLAEERLEASEAAFRALAHRLLEAQEIERRTLAAELHDELGQLLTGLNLLLLSIMPNDDRAALQKRLAQAQQTVGELTQRIRRISLDLRPPMLDDLGLQTTLEWLITRYREQTQLTITFDDQTHGERFLNLIELAAYRVTQEALTNAVRHAAASQIAVRLWSEAGMLYLEITDNGRGFNQAALQPYSSSGIAGMRERTVLLGGSLSIESTPGMGTRIFACLPFTADLIGQEPPQ